MWKQILWLLLAIILGILATALELSQSVPEGVIHIRLVEGHAITTPDVIAVGLLLAAVTAAGIGLWPWREGYKTYLVNHPFAASILIAILGIGTGFLIGVLTGARFPGPFRTMARSIIRPIDIFFNLVGDLINSL